MRKQQAKNRGLTLIELLVTIMIMGIVIAVAVPVIRPPVDARSVKEAARMVSTAATGPAATISSPAVTRA